MGALIAESIRARLLAGGLSSGDRVFADFAPESTPKPYTVIYEIGGEVIYAQDAPVDLKQARIQISVFGSSGTSVTADLSMIRALLHYARWTDTYVRVQSSLAIEERAVIREPETLTYHAQQDYRVRYL